MSRRSRGEAGEAVLEFIAIAVLIIIPLGYVAMAVMTVQSASVASAHAAREAARAFTLATDPESGVERARTAVELALADQGFSQLQREPEVRVECAACLSPGSLTRIEVRWEVPLPWLPMGAPVGVPVSATQVVVTDVHRSA